MNYDYPIRFDNQDCMLSKTRDKDCDRVSIRHDKDCEYPYDDIQALRVSISLTNKHCECPYA